MTVIVELPYFLLYMWDNVFLLVKTKSDVHFHWLELETLNNPEKFKISGLSGINGARWQKWIPDLDSTCQRTLEWYLVNPENSR